MRKAISDKSPNPGVCVRCGEVFNNLPTDVSGCKPTKAVQELELDLWKDRPKRAPVKFKDDRVMEGDKEVTKLVPAQVSCHEIFAREAIVRFVLGDGRLHHTIAGKMRPYHKPMESMVEKWGEGRKKKPRGQRTVVSGPGQR